MITNKYFLAMCFVALSMLGFNNHAVFSEQSPIANVPISIYLNSICPTLGCHVTFEDREGSRLVNAYVPDNRDVKSVDGLVEFLRKSLDNSSITVMSNQVINIRDSSFTNDSRYPLGTRLSLNYDGSLDLLADAIGNKLDGSVRTATGFPMTMLNEYDFTSAIRLKAENEPVRSILTNHLNMKNYYSILWSAETYLYKGKQVTYIHFWALFKRDPSST